MSRSSTCRVRRGRSPGGAVQRSTRCTGTADHLRHQPPCVGPAGPAGQRGRCAPVSLRVHVFGLRICRRGPGHRERAAAAVDPYAESKVRVEADVAAMADESFRPCSCVMPLLSVSHRGCGPTSCSTTWSDTPFSPAMFGALGWHAVAAVGARAGHRHGIPAALEAPVDKVHCAAYNVGSESNNLTVAEIAQSVVDVVPGAKLLITGETGADPRSYRVDFSAFRRRAGFRGGMVDPGRCRRTVQGIHAAASPADDFAKKFTRLPHLEALRASGILDESMRRITADA